MYKFLFAFFLVAGLSSCFLFNEYRKREFTYTDNGRSTVVPITIPKGYSKQERIDTVGIQMTTYYYPGGAMLYTAFLADTNTILQPIPDSLHQALEHKLGGKIYKGQDSTRLFYREIQLGRLRYGYRFVPWEREGDFDEATNLSSLQKR